MFNTNDSQSNVHTIFLDKGKVQFTTSKAEDHFKVKPVSKSSNFWMIVPVLFLVILVLTRKKLKSK